MQFTDSIQLFTDDPLHGTCVSHNPFFLSENSSCLIKRKQTKFMS